jgi:hypothetical protein
MDYIRHNSDRCPSSQDKKHIWPGSGGGSHGNRSNATAAPQNESARLAGVGAAMLVVVVVLSGLAVYQKRAEFQHRWQHRDFASLAAAREYEGSEDENEGRSMHCDHVDDGNDASEAHEKREIKVV